MFGKRCNAALMLVITGGLIIVIQYIIIHYSTPELLTYEDLTGQTEDVQP